MNRTQNVGNQSYSDDMDAQYGPHRFSGGGNETTTHRGATFNVADLRDTRFVDCDLTNAKIIDSVLVDVDISGYVENLVINGVDVTAYVEEELNRRHPERLQLRSLGSIEDFRAMWTTIENLWSTTTARAKGLQDEKVDSEWSFAETLRHLIFIADSWASRTILDQERPYHPFGITPSWYKASDAAALGIDVDATPSYDEVLAVRADRMTVIRRILDDLTNADLGRPCQRTPAPGYPEEARPVAECLWVVMEEEIEHHRYATRDLAVLETRS